MAVKSKNSEYFVLSPSAIHWRVFSQYWWVLLFVVVVYCAYSHSMSEKQKEIVALKEILSDLEEKKCNEIELHEELMAHRASRSDPEYIKLLLMKNLGLVGEGQVKVTFQ